MKTQRSQIRRLRALWRVARPTSDDVVAAVGALGIVVAAMVIFN